MKKTSLLILAFLSSFLYGQSKDSLLNSPYQYLTDKYYEYKYTDSLKAKRYLNIMLEKSLKENNLKENIDAHYLLNEINNEQEEFIPYIDSLIAITSKKPNKDFPAIAYFEKGRYYSVKRERDKSIKEFLKTSYYAEKYKNDSINYIVKIHLGLLLSRKDKRQGLNAFLDVYKKYSLEDDFVTSTGYISLLLNISYNYVKLSKYDSAQYYINKADKYNRDYVSDTLYTPYVRYRQGIIHFYKDEHQRSIDSIERSLLGIYDDENFQTLMSASVYLIQSSIKTKNFPKAYKYSNYIDSLNTMTGINHEGQRVAYNYLTKYHRKNNDYEKQLYYINKFLHIDSILRKVNSKTDRIIFENFDKPKLLAERDEVIDKLQDELIHSNILKSGAFIVVAIVLFLFGYQYKKRRKLKSRFDKIIQQKNESNNDEIKKEISNIDLPESLIERVSKELVDFEKNQGFIASNINLSNLAHNFDTNSNYLSKIINHYKGVGFSTYINNLRINYTIKLLDSDTKIRKYSIKGIAQEVGYKNAESFSNAFHKKTGLKPSYYIKQLEKSNV